MARKRPADMDDAPEDTGTTNGGNYFTSPKENMPFIPSGCKVLDLTLGGGWPVGRISNVVGDASSGKTLLAIESCANFSSIFTGPMWYREAEAAFDESYAAALGMPIENVNFIPDDQQFETIEDWYEDFERELQAQDDNTPGHYILDSLDALSDRAELQRKIDEQTYGMTKQKKLGELFRKLVRIQERKNVHLMVISQVRDNIDAGSFGAKYRRSGGKSLDFYASQALWLSHMKTLKKQVRGISRPYGIHVGAKCKKNKVGLPGRQCEFDVIFGFGIDDLGASLAFLEETKANQELNLTQKDLTELRKGTLKLDSDEYAGWLEKANPIVEDIWYEIDSKLMPKRTKYGG